MKGLNPYMVNMNGMLMNLGEPQVMGILNVTPDSFYAESRVQTESQIEQRVRQILEEGGSIIDIGACSTRPGAEMVSQQEEMNRLSYALRTLRRIAPDAIVSVDTFRADVAKMCVQEYGVQMVNDVSGGSAEMFRTIAELRVPYVLTHGGGLAYTAQQKPHYENLMVEILQYFGSKVQELHELGVGDIVLDPGWGFGKTMKHNYELMERLDDLKVMELPILAGVSRKSMIYGLLDCTPQDAQNGTTVLNTIALLKGASILRVHDVKACAEVVKIVRTMREGC